MTMRLFHDSVEFPTCVGMNRQRERLNDVGEGVPHMRGDEPHNRVANTLRMKSSPHAWG